MWATIDDLYLDLAPRAVGFYSSSVPGRFG